MANEAEIEKKLDEMLTAISNFAEFCNPKPTHQVVVFWDQKSGEIEGLGNFTGVKDMGAVADMLVSYAGQLRQQAQIN